MKRCLGIGIVLLLVNAFLFGCQIQPNPTTTLEPNIDQTKPGVVYSPGENVEEGNSTQEISGYSHQAWTQWGVLPQQGPYAGTGTTEANARYSARWTCQEHQIIQDYKDICMNYPPSDYWHVNSPKSEWVPLHISYYGYNKGNRTAYCQAYGWDSYNSTTQNCCNRIGTQCAE